MVTLRAYAKINIGLRILKKRTDGYHSLETVFCEVHPFDELMFSHHPTISVESNSAALPSDESNLCFKAAQLLKRTCNYPDGVQIVLKKNIPIGAGLGGGSSDAAATLRGVNKLWNLQLPVSQLEQLAATLGSDVPFFVRGGCAYGTGRGEILESAPISNPFYTLVVTPPIHVSTAWAYQALQFQENREPIQLHRIVAEAFAHSRISSSDILNDFEEVVFRAHPEIAKIKSLLMNKGALFALLSGSGSSVFGFFEDEKAVNNVMESLPPQCSAFITPPHFQREHNDT
jgi:4-diphosphocytidyl-2-C-methyl-D-erythritol kinase